MLSIDCNLSEIIIDPDFLAAIARGKRSSLGKMGTWMRRGVRNLLKRRKRVAGENEPPSIHSPEPNLSTVLWDVDQGNDMVSVGPVRTPGSRTGQPVAALMERGGRAVILDRRGRPITATYRPHPFMLPALDAVTPNLPLTLRDLLSEE